jgi:hypothetical protein
MSFQRSTLWRWGGVVVATLFTGVAVEDLTTGGASAATKHGRVLHQAVPQALSTAPSDCANGEAIATLEIREVRADDATVYVDLDHSAPNDVDLGSEAQRPRVYLEVAGCRVGVYEAEEEVAARARDAATVSVPLRVLPDGDVTLTFLALNAVATTHLRSAMEQRHVLFVPDPNSPDGRLIPMVQARRCAVADVAEEIQ